MTPAQLRKYLEPDFMRGLCFWKARPLDDFDSEKEWRRWRTRYAGRNAGQLKPDGYWCMTLFGTRYLRGRLMWALQTGEWPKVIDHINGDRRDDRLVNLRDVTPAINARNRFLNCRNKTGRVGVFYRQNRDFYEVYCCIDGSKMYLGNYKSKQTAVAVREAAEYLAVLNGFGFSERHGTLNKQEAA